MNVLENDLLRKEQFVLQTYWWQSYITGNVQNN